MGWCGRACFTPDVTDVLVVTRSPARLRHPKLRELTIADFADLSPFRPGLIQPTHGARSRTGWYDAVYTVTAALIPLLRRSVPGHVTTTEAVGRALPRAVRTGFPRRVVTGADM
ncbi:hypothetical protein FHX34_104692 [Actinoplanes teichomyceticus]|uniref:Uncharacterized protein n=1 Tax=Actinoplanes teichomyceticus TaxID=1867 RepID=A0A561VS06_ACTTI|nr:hypothetical protein FHX34_104692 [Actinoplanes teichomyceticus]GIF13047.1 hypothetical protein Ate01nite_30790 [Actinoplanes teichomyceticus]